jgi:hypothetical protein
VPHVTDFKSLPYSVRFPSKICHRHAAAGVNLKQRVTTAIYAHSGPREEKLGPPWARNCCSNLKKSPDIKITNIY